MLFYVCIYLCGFYSKLPEELSMGKKKVRKYQNKIQKKQKLKKKCY